MKNINGRWYDENNNSWSVNVDTEESALAKSKTLSDCSYCRGCSYYKLNPQRYTTPKVGSRNSQKLIYWTNKYDVQIICGCWRGCIADFEKRVKEVHAKTGHLKPYLNQISIFKYLVNSK